MSLPIRSGERRAVVHIGLNKTGSSTIQAWLAQNQAGLAAQGVTFDPLDKGAAPTPFAHVVGYGCLAMDLAGREMKSSHIRQAHGITDAASWTARVAEFRTRAEASMAALGPGTYVISSEWMAEFVNKGENVQALDSWLCARFDRVIYVLYLRDQRDWVASAYAQYVKTGGADTLEKFIARRGKYDYNLLVRRWLAVARRPRVAVRLLTPDFLTDGDLIADFSGLLGVDTAPLSPAARVNESLSAASVETLLKVNQVAALMPKSVALKMRRAVLGRELAREGPKLKLTDAQAEGIATRNAETNEKLRNLLFAERAALFR